MIFRSKQHIGRIVKASSRSVGAAYQSKRARRSFFYRLFKKLAMVITVVGVIGCIIGGAVVFTINRNLPSVDGIATYIPAETTKIYSADEVILAELHREENRILIPIEKISPILQKTVIAMEDTDFYEHHGINIKGILRALWVDIRAGAFVQGGSTLTQQLARHLYLYKQKKLVRKIAEMILAIKIERKYTKTEILEMYLNQVYWGHNSYGIESASQMYFGKRASELTLAESAALVAMLSAPEHFSPFRNYARCKQRQKQVLDRMQAIGLIDEAQVEDAFNEELVLAQRKKHRYKAPFFTSHVVEQLIEMYGEESTFTSGMKVYTTLDYGLQQKAEEIVKKYVELGNKPYWIKGEKVPSLNYQQGAILSIDPRTGYIKVMQGGVDFKENEFNRTTQAIRQPGSAFKPFVYLAALEKGFSPGSIIEDGPVTFNTIEGPYQPLNYNLKFSGKLPISRALERSVNVVAVKLNDWVGPSNVVDVAKRIGITSPLKPILSLPLGANEVTMLELMSTYMVFANGGIKVEPTAILRIEDRDGIPLYKHSIKEKKVYDANLIATLVEMMEGVVNYGTGRGAKLPRPIAGKTGTTSDYKDAWFFGFVPQLVTATWVGNDDNTPMINVTGGWMPSAMWREFMKEALSDVPAQGFPKPKGLVTRKVNWDTGLITSRHTPEDARVSLLKYWSGKEPVDFDQPGSTEIVQSEDEEKKKEDENILDFFDI